MLAGVVPWVNNSIDHQFGVGLSRGSLGHAVSQLSQRRVIVEDLVAWDILGKDKEEKMSDTKEDKERTRSTQQHITYQLR